MHGIAFQYIYAKAPWNFLSWTFPFSPHFKIHFDASFVSTGSKVFGHGVVIRNHEGVFIVGPSKCQEGSANAELAQTFAAREAVCLAKTLKIPSLF